MATHSGAMAVSFARQHKVTPSGADLSKMSRMAHVGWEFVFWGIVGVFISLCCIAISIEVFLILLAISLSSISIGTVLLMINKKRKASPQVSLLDKS